MRATLPVIFSGDQLIFETPEEIEASIVTGDLMASGDGTIEFNGNTITIEEGKTASFKMSLTEGGMEINEGAQVLGDGTLTNLGRMVINDRRPAPAQSSYVTTPASRSSTISLVNVKSSDSCPSRMSVQFLPSATA